MVDFRILQQTKISWCEWLVRRHSQHDLFNTIKQSSVNHLDQKQSRGWWTQWSDRSQSADSCPWLKIQCCGLNISSQHCFIIINCEFLILNNHSFEGRCITVNMDVDALAFKGSDVFFLQDWNCFQFTRFIFFRYWDPQSQTQQSTDVWRLNTTILVKQSYKQHDSASSREFSQTRAERGQLLPSHHLSIY